MPISTEQQVFNTFNQVYSNLEAIRLSAELLADYQQLSPSHTTFKRVNALAAIFALLDDARCTSNKALLDKWNPICAELCKALSGKSAHKQSVERSVHSTAYA